MWLVGEGIERDGEEACGQKGEGAEGHISDFTFI
jgi:hypothetical protein